MHTSFAAEFEVKNCAVDMATAQKDVLKLSVSELCRWLLKHDVGEDCIQTMCDGNQELFLV